MAAQGGTRDKILRVSMPFEKGMRSTRISKAGTRQKRLLLGSLPDPWAVVLKVHSWAALFKEGRVRSYAEIARREGITRARVSQLWPLSRIAKKKADEALTDSKGKEISLRKLIRIARNSDVK
jgi:hypothetical protein